MKKYLNGVLVDMDTKEAITFESERKKENLKNKKDESDLLFIESQMKVLNLDRKNLQDLIKLWLDAPWDIEKVKEKEKELARLSKKRKKLIWKNW